MFAFKGCEADTRKSSLMVCLCMARLAPSEFFRYHRSISAASKSSKEWLRRSMAHRLSVVLSIWFHDCRKNPKESCFSTEQLANETKMLAGSQNPLRMAEAIRCSEARIFKDDPT